MSELNTTRGADDEGHARADDPGRREWLRAMARAAIAGGMAYAVPGFAQSGAGYPAPGRPITLICPWTAGGPTDAVFRALGEAFGRTLNNHRVVIENKGGAGGALGAQYVAQQGNADGYLLTQTPLGVFRLPFLVKTNFNPVTDLTYILCIAGYNFGLSVRADTPWKTWKEFVADAKANPNKIRYGSPGIGTSLHVTMEDLAQREGLKWVHVPYKGSAQSQAAMMGGEVDAMAGTPPWGLVEAGKVRVLNTWSANRPARAPNVPTLKELYGIVANSPWGIAGPKGMDPKVVKIIHDAVRKAMEDATFLRVLDNVGQEIYYMNGEAYTQFARQALETEKEVVQRLGLAKG
jgi:tripartite-type tricarboxylate transporter receptor subunit TctC